MAEVKDKHITNKIIRKKFFDIPNIEKKTGTRQLTFIGKMARNSDDYLPTKILTECCNHKRKLGGVLHMNKKSIVQNLHLIIPGVDKTGALKTWAHFAIDERYWRNSISGLVTSST